MQRLLAGAALFIAVFSLFSCETTTVVPVPVDTLRVSPEALELEVESFGYFSATAVDDDGQPLPGRAVDWSSSEPDVARVTDDGVVTAVAEGDAVITATSDGASGTASIHVVPVSVAAVEISPDHLELEEGETESLSATPRDEEGNPLIDRELIWSSSDEAVATVSSEGEVTGVEEGRATITATSEGHEGTATVEVSGGLVIGGGI